MRVDPSISVKSKVTVPDGRLRLFDGLWPFSTACSVEGTKVVRPVDSVLNCSSKALAKSCTFAKRCCGSLARALNTIFSIVGEIHGISACREGGGVESCWLVICCTDPVKGA